MKIKIEKQLTLACQMEHAKAKAREFKQRYTDNDLKNAFEGQTELDAWGDILKCEVTAFPETWYSEEMTYWVELTIEATTDFKRVRFYVDENLNITNEDLIQYKVFK